MKRIVRFTNGSSTVALPSAVKQILNIQKGDSIEFEIKKNGTITIKKA